jgi:chaperonin GroEL
MAKIKQVNEFSEVRARILSGLNKLSAPVIATLTPAGTNVIFQDDTGTPSVTNDGWTIAKHIVLEDPIEDTIADMVRHAAARTNYVAGDGTSTTILLTDFLVKQGFSLIDSGMNQMSLKREFDKMGKLLVDEIPKFTHKVSGKKDLEFVARVSSNGDEEIAKNTASVIDKVKEDGMVFIEHNPQRTDTQIVEELGFLMESGMYSTYLSNLQGRLAARYDDVAVIITDKRLYYEDECVAILNAVAAQGLNSVVIVAADFIGQAPNFFLANHTNKDVNMNILMVKAPSPDVMEVLANYLGGQVYTEKRGSMVSELKKEDFITATRVFSDPNRTIFSAPSKKNIVSDLRVKALREAMKEMAEGSPEFDHMKKRIACMTNGIVTIKVGGSTIPEMNEKIFRYEDSINATRNALKNGYVVGGGVTLHSLAKSLTKGRIEALTGDVQDVLVRFCDASLRQIAINCNKSFKEILEKTTKVDGYNASTDKFENLLEAGIIEPSIVLKMSIENAVSAAGSILSSNFIITNLPEKDDK